MIATHSPLLTVVVFKGHIITGFSEGSMVTIERDEAAWTLAVGAKGTTTRVHNANENGVITVNLQQNSPSNEVLGAFFRLDDPRRGVNLGVGDALVKEMNSTLLARSANAWVVGIPTMSRAKDFGGLEWKIACSPLKVDGFGSQVAL